MRAADSGSKTESSGADRDRNGFLIPHDLLNKYRSLQTRGSTNSSTDWPALLAQALKKQYRAGGPLPPKFVAAVRDGIPPEHRARAWMLLSGAQQRMESQPQLYRQLLTMGEEHGLGDESNGNGSSHGTAGNVGKTAGQSVEAAINLDVWRTFPEHPRLTSEFVDKMRRVLLAYARRNPEVAYCQGMNFIAASLLLFVDDEEEAFWLLSFLVEEVLPDQTDLMVMMVVHLIVQLLIQQIQMLLLLVLEEEDMPQEMQHRL